VRSERLARWCKKKTDPFSVAFRVAAAALYGASSTPTVPESGTAEIRESNFA